MWQWYEPKQKEGGVMMLVNVNGRSVDGQHGFLSVQDGGIQVMNEAEARSLLERSKTGPRRTETWRLSKDGAAVLMESTPHKRIINYRRVRQYESDLARGDWEATGESIRVGSDGYLLNGHHRCIAIGNGTYGDRLPEVDITLHVDPRTKKLQDRALPARASDFLDRTNGRSAMAVIGSFLRWVKNDSAGMSRSAMLRTWDAFGDERIQRAALLSHRRSSGGGGAPLGLMTLLVDGVDSDLAREASECIVNLDFTGRTGPVMRTWANHVINNPSEQVYKRAQFAARMAQHIVNGTKTTAVSVLPYSDSVGKLFNVDHIVRAIFDLDGGTRSTPKSIKRSI